METKNKKDFVFASRLVNLIIFDLLIVGTPLTMLKTHLQDSVRSLSLVKLSVFNYDISIVIVIALIVLIYCLSISWRHFTKTRVIALLLCFCMIALGQSTADYYSNHTFYDLQNNWHYLAYCGFAFVMYRFYHPRGIPAYKLIILTFVEAFILSGFDEGFQLFVSDRVFDISDIAKDVYGTVMGVIAVYFIVENGEIVKNGWKFRHKKFKDYYKNPTTLIFLEFVLAYLNLFISSQLTEYEYNPIAYAIIISLFVIFLLILHYSQFKIPKIVFSSILIVAIAVQSFFFLKYKDDNIIYNERHLTIYKGIPIPYFDIMIFPNGFFRFVDKKKSFNLNDREVINLQKADILIMGTGSDGSGGQGFSARRFMENPILIYNTRTKKGMQLALLKTPEACTEFNRLKRNGKNVLFVMHSE